VPAKWGEAGGQLAQACYGPRQHGWREIVSDDVVGSADGLVAVARLFRGDYLAPPGQSVSFDVDQKDEPRIYAPVAGLERLIERQADEADFNSVDAKLVGDGVCGPANDLG
jgi:hypothetical protein